MKWTREKVSNEQMQYLFEQMPLPHEAEILL